VPRSKHDRLWKETSFACRKKEEHGAQVSNLGDNRCPKFQASSILESCDAPIPLNEAAKLAS